MLFSPPNEKEATPSQKKKNSILIVEDQPVAAEVIKKILVDLSCNVDIAINGSNALVLIKQNYYDLILMDIGLPDIDGYEITKKIRLHESSGSHKVPIIALTAHVDVTSKKLCLTAGMNAIFTKPLLKKQAIQILELFIPYYTKILKSDPFQEDQNSSTLDEKIIDFKIAKEILGNEKVIKQVLTMLINNLKEEDIKLDEAYEKKDWGKIQEIAHKFSGGASYCGALRLKEACTSLKNYITQNNLELSHSYYHKMRQEMQNLTQYITHNGI